MLTSFFISYPESLDGLVPKMGTAEDDLANPKYLIFDIIMNILASPQIRSKAFLKPETADSYFGFYSD